jgi:RES domain-containing protein
MPVDPHRVAEAPWSALAGTGWRHLGPLHDPLSGEGARLNGGRFNPPDSFAGLYLCTTRPCAVAEIRRLGERQAIGVENLLPRVLYRYEIQLERVLDLTAEEDARAVGISRQVLIGPDWSECQALGTIAHALGIQAIRSPSAAGVDDVLAVFVQHIGIGTIEPSLVQEWHSISDLGNS